MFLKLQNIPCVVTYFAYFRNVIDDFEFFHEHFVLWNF